MIIWAGFRNGTKGGESVLILHVLKWHVTFFGGFRDNGGTWHDNAGIVVCKCGAEV